MSGKILLVEDMMTNILLAPALEKRKFTTVQTSSFEEAKVEISKYKDFKAAIIDLNLDDTKDGAIVDYMIEQNIPVLIYSDTYEHSQVEDFINKPIVDFIVKRTSEDIYYLERIITRLKEYKNLNVLIVDDSTMMRTMVSDFIKPLGFNTIFESSNGIEALETIKKEENISLVITDYNMPQMDGLELIENIRKRYQSDTMAIISITSEVDISITSQLLKFGVSGYLRKPYLKNNLNSIIHNEMSNLFAKQKNVKYQKDLASYVKKIKTDHIADAQKDKGIILKLEKENKELQNNIIRIEKDMSNLVASNELLKTKLNMQAERIGQKKEVFKANEIINN